MLKNYFKTAIRNFWKNKTSSLINIFGLTIGLTCCLLISVYIKHELSYDNFEQKGNRIARVIMEYNFAGSPATNKGNFTSVRVASVFSRTFPEIESAIKMTEYERVIGYKNQFFDEKNFMYSDSTFFSFFSFKTLEGDIHKMLTSPYQVVLTRSTAKKYFGNEEPIGKVLRVGNDSNLYQITGVIQDCPDNSQIKFDFLASFSSLGIDAEWEKTYWDANYTTYLLFKNETSIASLQAKLPAFMKKEMQGQGASVNFYLEPFTKIHLYSPYGGFEPNNSITYIYILAGVALLILIIACSTYINLSTARSIERAKEVGVRKVIGAENKQLFWQFIGESGLICFLAVILSLLFAFLLLPYFNELSAKKLSPDSLFSPAFILFSISTALSISVIAGSYPALILSGFQPVKVLKGAFKNSSSGQWLRKSLIVFQFAISGFLIVSTFVMQKQMYFVQHKKLGYDRDHVLILPINNFVLNHMDLIKQQFTLNRDVLSVSRCHRSPVEGGGGYSMRAETMPANQQIAVIANPADEDFIKTTSLQLIAGTGYSATDVKLACDTDSKKRIYSFVLNETAAKQLGWLPQEAIGKKMFLGDNRPGYVKGVVRDFNFQSLHDPIKGYILFPEAWSRELLLKLSGKNLPQTISFLESKWKTIVPDRPFEYRFMDDDYNKLYDSEMRLGKVMTLFSTIAIILACLGLFGLSSFTAQQRYKEIGIRKVLGASIGDIVVALSMGFIRLTCLAIVISFPLAWWMMTKWLQDFTYKTDMTWRVYLAAALLTLFLAIATTAIHAMRAAFANPVESLRIE